MELIEAPLVGGGLGPCVCTPTGVPLPEVGVAVGEVGADVTTPHGIHCELLGPNELVQTNEVSAVSPPMAEHAAVLAASAPAWLQKS